MGYTALLGYARTATPLFKASAVLVHVCAALLLAMMTYTLKTYMAPTTPLVVWKSFALHPLLMTFAFGFLSPIMSISWRVYGDYLGCSRQSVKLLHFTLATLVVSIGTAGVYDMWLVHAGGAQAQVDGLSLSLSRAPSRSHHSVAPASVPQAPAVNSLSHLLPRSLTIPLALTFPPPTAWRTDRQGVGRPFPVVPLLGGHHRHHVLQLPVAVWWAPRPHTLAAPCTLCDRSRAAYTARQA